MLAAVSNRLPQFVFYLTFKFIYRNEGKPKQWLQKKQKQAGAELDQAQTKIG